MPNILAEFEKRYTGHPEDTMEICEAIAKEFNLDVEEVADFVYVNRYKEDASLDSLSDIPEPKDEELEDAEIA